MKFSLWKGKNVNDNNLEKIEKRMKLYRQVENKDKRQSNMKEINFLGYRISGNI